MKMRMMRLVRGMRPDGVTTYSQLAKKKPEAVGYR
jgi:hypothetical protein